MARELVPRRLVARRQHGDRNVAELEGLEVVAHLVKQAELVKLADQLRTLKRADPAALGTYLRNVRLTLLDKAGTILMEERS